LKALDSVPQNYISNQAFAAFYGVTRDCKNPELAFRLLDWAYSDEFTISSTWGVKGETWDYDANGEVELIGDFTIPEKLEAQAKTLSNIYYLPSRCALWQKYSKPVYKVMGIEPSCIWFSDANDELAEYYHLANILYYYTDEETEIISEYSPDLSTYINECQSKFISGEMPLSEFDNYRARLKEMGLDKITEIYVKHFGN